MAFDAATPPEQSMSLPVGLLDASAVQGSLDIPVGVDHVLRRRPG